MLPTEDPHVLGGTVTNLVVRTACLPRFVSAWAKGLATDLAQT